MEGKRTIESTGSQITEANKLGGAFVRKAKPQFIEDRYFPCKVDLSISRWSKQKLIKYWLNYQNRISPLL
jgi:hypothetical protein